ncbi:unnamed protein product, partial [Ixodes hexagonus]
IVTLRFVLAGVLVFWSPFHDPRVHESAPAGVHVTTVRALDESAPDKPVAYSLLDVKDHAFFNLNHVTGNLTTAKSINRKAGEKYEVMVAAVSQGLTEVKTLLIEVTVPNEHPPVFERALYRSEVHQTRTRPGYRVVQVRAHDSDPVPYNAEVYYRLEPGPESTRALRYLALDGITGEVMLNRSLADVSEPTIAFTVIAEDGGSPKRQARTRVELQVKTISDPQNTRALVSNETSVRICWQRPLYGNVSGYVIKYKAASDNVTSFVNVTTEAVDKCTPVQGLKPWTEYEYRVYAWNSREEGLGSPVDRFATRMDYCLLNVCKHGSCETTRDKPGYRCLCEPGYYGDTCDWFDPCSQNPCRTFGTCVNTSRDEYRCDCFTGFSGRNCSTFDPCALRPSACLHDGVCRSNASHTFTCLCVDGYYGKTCLHRDPCFSSPCLNRGRCLNQSDVEFTCRCEPGFAGDLCEHNVDECLSSPCKNRGDCEDGINSFTCHCPGGYRGPLCELRESCPEEFQQTDKGMFHWQPVQHGSIAKVECPYGAYNPSSEYKYARRKCRLLPTGQTSWMKVSAQHCRYKSFQTAENITSELEFLTHDPGSIRPDQLLSFAEKIEPVVEYAIKDIKIAQAMIHVISNFLALNDSVIDEGDADGSAVERLRTVVEKFTSEVVLGSGALIIENENLVVKAADSPAATSRRCLHLIPRQRGRQRRAPSLRLGLPRLGISRRISGEPFRPIHEVEKGPRISFVSYRNDKFFRPLTPKIGDLVLQLSASCVFLGQVVLSAKIGQGNVENLSDPLVYSYPTYSSEKYVCAYWDERKREWSTAGITTNQSGNVTVCSSTHLTAFSLLLDPMPDLSTPAHHYRILSLISHIGCIMSIIGLFFTILTYALFRWAFGRDVDFLLRRSIKPRIRRVSFYEINASPPYHYLFCILLVFELFSTNALIPTCNTPQDIFQRLVSQAPSDKMVSVHGKQQLKGLRLPAAVVATCVVIDMEPYQRHDEFCVLSSRNPYIYYIAFLGIACLILFINLLVFIMVTRVLFTPRMATKAAANNSNSSNSASGNSAPPITAAQVRGAFTVMTLLGVTWIFGVFAVGDARTVFQYIFCVCNSMQGFLIFVVRVLQYPEARSAWFQLMTRGTLKKHRGSGPPGGSWCANSSNPKQNSHSSMVRMTSTSTDSTSTVVFNSNIWNRNSGKESGPTKLSRFSGVGSLLKNCHLQKEENKHNSLPRKKKTVIVEETVDSKENHKEFYSSEDQVSALVKVPELYSKEEREIVKSNSVNPNEPLKFIDEESRAAAGFATQKAHILFAYADGETTPIRINGIVHSPVEKPKVECFSTFQRPSPAPGAPKIPELPQSWKNRETDPLTTSSDYENHDPELTPLKITEETSFLTANSSSATVVS